MNQSPKHILLLTWKDLHHPHAWWAEKVMYQYAQRLVRDGYRVTWFASSYPWAPESEDIDGIHIIRRYTAHTIWMRAHSWYKQFQRENHIDIIIDEAGGWPLLSPLYEKHISIYFFAHHIGDKEFDVYPWPIGTLAKYVYRRLFSLYRDTETITVSGSTRDELVSDFWYSRERITVIDNTTELTPIESIDISTKTHDFVFLGRLTAIKRPIDAVLAYSIALAQLPTDSRLHIIGNAQDTAYVETLREAIREHHLQERVILHGHLPQEEFSRILRTSRALLVPSEKEWYGLIVLEANACGTPAIVYDVAWLRDSTHDGINWVLVPYGDTQAMADAMVDMLANTQKYHTLCASSLAHIQSIPTWDEQYTKLKTTISL